jgi:hypothetical protein
VAAYDWLMKKNWRLHAEAYLQKLTAIPVVNDVNRTFWMLNMIDGYANEPLSRGKGKNIGVDITIEKFFSGGLFVLTGFSIYNSTYQPLNGTTYNTQYNCQSAGSLTAGREWKWKKEKTFVIGGKMLYNGGMPITPLLAGATVNSREPLLDEARPFTEKIPVYFRTDARISLRKIKREQPDDSAGYTEHHGISNTDG